jgi:hypothetical protein
MSNQKTYKLPVNSIPSMDYSHHLDDMLEFQSYLNHKGIKTKNTRIERYISYLDILSKNSKVLDAARIFKNSSQIQMHNRSDWVLYVLREVHELAWILKGLKITEPKGIDEKLKVVVNGSDFAALDTDSHSRNIQFELRIASYFCQSKCEVDLTKGTDVIALSEKFAYFVECKRIASEAQLSKRLQEAKQQLKARMPKKYMGRKSIGCIAGDVTKVAFPHNGLTWGLTNEHCRDILQEKLKEISYKVRPESFFEFKSVSFYWLQIHIAALIQYPITPMTRFSSYQIQKDPTNSKERTTRKAFNDIFESASLSKDPREIAPSKLIKRKELIVPAGSIFKLEREKVLKFSQEISETDITSNPYIGELTINDNKNEFYLYDISLLSNDHINAWKTSRNKSLEKADLELLIKMYLNRYPYEQVI